MGSWVSEGRGRVGSRLVGRIREAQGKDKGPDQDLWVPKEKQEQ